MFTLEWTLALKISEHVITLLDIGDHDDVY